MAASEKPVKETDTSRLKEDIKKGISAKKLQNLVLQKILDSVGSEKTTHESGRSSKSKPNHPK